MAEIDDLLAQREALRRSLYQGVQTTETGDRRVTFMAAGDMAKIEAALTRRIDQLNGCGGRRWRTLNTTTSKGL